MAADRFILCSLPELCSSPGNRKWREVHQIGFIQFRPEFDADCFSSIKIPGARYRRAHPRRTIVLYTHPEPFVPVNPTVCIFMKLHGYYRFTQGESIDELFSSCAITLGRFQLRFQWSPDMCATKSRHTINQLIGVIGCLF